MMQNLRLLNHLLFKGPISKNVLAKCHLSDLARNKQSLSWLEEATIYIHWPYCERRCSYCNFNKYISKNVNQIRMQNCLIKEIKYLLNLSGVKYIKSIFFGGGTPSLADPSTIDSIIRTAAPYLRENAEITIEANPTGVETSKLRDFKAAGVNRISIGVQTLENDGLVVLNRNHSVKDSLRCIEMAKDIFPGRCSFDLMFGRPDQTLVAWEKELSNALTYADNHISLYELTLERGTRLFKDVKAGRTVMPNPDIVADMYNTAVQVLDKNGYVRYEASNFAKPGSETKHNQAYWEGCQYIGIGPGAHGRFVTTRNNNATKSRQARIQTLEPEAWMAEVEQFGHGTRKINEQTDFQVLEEILMIGLRTKDGIPIERWKLFDPITSSFDWMFEFDSVNDLIEAKLLNISSERLNATPNGLNVIDSITPVLLDVLYKFKEKSS